MATQRYKLTNFDKFWLINKKLEFCQNFDHSYLCQNSINQHQNRHCTGLEYSESNYTSKTPETFVELDIP